MGMLSVTAGCAAIVWFALLPVFWIVCVTDKVKFLLIASVLVEALRLVLVSIYHTLCKQGCEAIVRTYGADRKFCLGDTWWPSIPSFRKECQNIPPVAQLKQMFAGRHSFAARPSSILPCEAAAKKRCPARHLAVCMPCLLPNDMVVAKDTTKYLLNHFKDADIFVVGNALSTCISCSIVKEMTQFVKGLGKRAKFVFATESRSKAENLNLLSAMFKRDQEYQYSHVLLFDSDERPLCTESQISSIMDAMMACNVQAVQGSKLERIHSDWKLINVASAYCNYQMFWNVYEYESRIKGYSQHFGSNIIISMDVFRSIPYEAGFLTEDMRWTEQLYAATGGIVVYFKAMISVGQGPRSIHSWMKQRQRWKAGLYENMLLSSSVTWHSECSWSIIYGRKANAILQFADVLVINPFRCFSGFALPWLLYVAWKGKCSSFDMSDLWFILFAFLVILRKIASIGVNIIHARQEWKRIDSAAWINGSSTYQALQKLFIILDSTGLVFACVDGNAVIDLMCFLEVFWLSFCKHGARANIASIWQPTIKRKLSPLKTP